jgi:hypothetical protein
MKFCRIAKWRESDKIVTIYKCNRLLVWSLNRGFNVEPPIAFVLHLE